MRPAPNIAVLAAQVGYGGSGMHASLPLLAAMGLCACPAPTALLSTHPGVAPDYVFSLAQPHFERALAHWSRLALPMRGVLTGFFGDEAQVRAAHGFLCDARPRGCVCLIDPVMGDGGRRYRISPEGMPRALRALVACADVVTPNLTEACLLLDAPFPSRAPTPGETHALLRGLRGLGARCAVLTGVPRGDGQYCDWAQQGDAEPLCLSYTPMGAQFFGAGDMFGALLLGLLALDRPLPEAFAYASEFVRRAMARTAAMGLPAHLGVHAESLFGELYEYCSHSVE